MQIRWLLIACLLMVAHAQADGLPPGVQRALDVRQVPAESLSIYVADVDSGETVLRWNDTESRNPASTIKLLTTLVALDVLGPAFRWKTDVYAMGEVDGDTLDGDLLIKGYGDPFLVTERVWQMLRNLRNRGIREIIGDLLIDDSYFDVGDYDPGAFDRQPLRAYNVAPNALLMNFKVVRYWFEPDHDTAAFASHRLDPPLENLTRRESARTHRREAAAAISAASRSRPTKTVRHDHVPRGKIPESAVSATRWTAPRSIAQRVRLRAVRLLWRRVGRQFRRRLAQRNLSTEDAEPLCVVRFSAAQRDDRARQQAQQQRDGAATVVHAVGRSQRCARYRGRRQAGDRRLVDAEQAGVLQAGRGERCRPVTRVTHHGCRHGIVAAICLAPAVHAGIPGVDVAVRPGRHPAATFPQQPS